MVLLFNNRSNNRETLILFLFSTEGAYIKVSLNKPTLLAVHTSCLSAVLVALSLIIILFGVAPQLIFAADPVAVDEQIGQTIPKEIEFRNEHGVAVRLADLITGPTIILPVYYSCTNVCAYQQGRMAGALKALPLIPAQDYRVISISFDENDTFESASRSKQTYLTSMKFPFPSEGWSFLTGNAINIKRFTDAIGYKFRREKNDFVHPVVSVVVSGDGKIIRYLYGITVLPKDITLALTEAKSGLTGASVRKLMEYCFSYDPEEKTYTFKLLRVSATVVIVCTGSFLAFLLLTGNQKRKNFSEKK